MLWLLYLWMPSFSPVKWEIRWKYCSCSVWTVSCCMNVFCQLFPVYSGSNLTADVVILTSMQGAYTCVTLSTSAVDTCISSHLYQLTGPLQYILCGVTVDRLANKLHQLILFLLWCYPTNCCLWYTFLMFWQLGYTSLERILEHPVDVSCQVCVSDDRIFA